MNKYRLFVYLYNVLKTPKKIKINYLSRKTNRSLNTIVFFISKFSNDFLTTVFCILLFTITENVFVRLIIFLSSIITSFDFFLRIIGKEQENTIL